MKVDGSAFKKAREKIRAKNWDVESLPGHPHIGTQEWLSNATRVNKTEISVRSIKNLEKGQGSLKTIRAVSKVLGMENYKEHIIDYALKCVSCSAESHIDFRPKQYPVQNPNSFSESIMLMTLDPLSITADSDSINSFFLKEVKARIIGLAKEIPFVWVAEVSLTDSKKGCWLGRVGPINGIHVEANDRPLNIPIMFKQDDASRILWCEFVTMVEESGKSQFDVEIELKFARFTKKFMIHVSIDLLKVLFQQGRKKHKSNWPYRAQLRTILSN